MRPDRHLVLLLCLIDVAVEHLKNGILPVDVSLVVLRDDLDLKSVKKVMSNS